jgi:membrane fusion protein (multidrug efflux system)
MTYPPAPGASRLRIAAALLCTALLAAGCAGEDSAPAPPPQEVHVLTVAAGTVPLDLEYSARARGVREVEVRSRVSGILLKRYYREGEAVPANALLFRIDPVPFQREVERLRGLAQIEQARLEQTTAQRDRVLALFPKGYVSQHERDEASAAQAAAAAAAQAANAGLRQAEINLSYTDVRAPIAGISGAEWRSEGSLVTAGEESGLLTTLVQTDQLYIDFAMPEQEAALVRPALLHGDVQVRLRSGSAAEIAAEARLEFLDTRVNADSGTVWARAVLDNRDARLSPGQFVLARVAGLQAPPALYVPVRAVLRTPEGAMAWVVDAAGRIAARPVTPGRMLGNLVEVREGLRAGERLVVDGILKVAPGDIVKPVELPLEKLVADARRSAVAEPEP